MPTLGLIWGKKIGMGEKNRISVHVVNEIKWVNMKSNNYFTK